MAQSRQGFGLSPLFCLYDLATDWVQMKPKVLSWKDSFGFQIKRPVQLDPRKGTSF